MKHWAFIAAVLALHYWFELPQCNAQQANVGYCSSEKVMQLLGVEMVLSEGQTTLEEWLAQIEGIVGLPILKDRDLDEDIVLKLPAGRITFASLLQQVAVQSDSHIVFFDQTAYIGPANRAVPLNTLIANRNKELRTFPKAVRDRWLNTENFSWPERVTSHELLSQMAADAQVRLEEFQLIEHDIWRAGQLAETSRVAFWTVVLIQFDCHFQFDPSGETVQIVGLDSVLPVELEQSFRVPRGVADANFRQLSQQFPGCRYQLTGRSVLVSGTAEWLDAVGQMLQSATTQK